MIFVCFFYCIANLLFFFFFFSSRRRHTRFDCDWSSDVCSSDLSPIRQTSRLQTHCNAPSAAVWLICLLPASNRVPRSETPRSEEHTSELQSQSNLVCRLLLEKKKNKSLHKHGH